MYVNEVIKDNSINGEIVYTSKEYYDENNKLICKKIYNKHGVLIYESSWDNSGYEK